MKINEIKLDSVKPVLFHGKEIGTIARRDCDSRTDCLHIHFAGGGNLELSAAVDISEQLEYPRVFTIEGRPDHMFMVFGGETAYWLTTDAKIQMQSPLFRRWSETEYWTTKVVAHNDELIVIYEAGVLVVDDLLNIKLHKQKLLNDFFVTFDGKALKFLRDHELEWLMPLNEENVPRC